MSDDKSNEEDLSSSSVSSVSSTASIPAAPIKAAPWGSTPNIRNAEEQQLQQLQQQSNSTQRESSPIPIPLSRSRDQSISSNATVVANHLLPNPTPPGSPTRQRAMNGPTTRPMLGSGVRSHSSASVSVKSSNNTKTKTKDDFIWGDIIGEGSFSTVTLAWDKLPVASPTPVNNNNSNNNNNNNNNNNSNNNSNNVNINNAIPQSNNNHFRSSIPSTTSSSSSISSQSMPPPKQARLYAMKELSQAHIVKENKIKYVTIEKHALQILNTDSQSSSNLQNQPRKNSLADQVLVDDDNNSDNNGNVRVNRKPKRNKNEGSLGIIRLWLTFREGAQKLNGMDYLHSSIGDSLFFALEYAPNGELLSWIKKMGSFDESSAKFYAAQTLSAIGFMHGRGIIHRDIKPENILLNKDMIIKITDFGSAKILDQSQDVDNSSNDERSKSFVGTAEYVSPELLRDRSVGKECDFWALGCIIYQMITGRPPFKAPNEYLTFQLIMKLDYTFPEKFPVVAKDLISKLLVLEPQSRLGSGSEGIEDIRNHEWFNDIDFDRIWNCKPPFIQTGMNEPQPSQSIPPDTYFEFGFDSDEEEEEGIPVANEDGMQHIESNDMNEKTQSPELNGNNTQSNGNHNTDLERVQSSPGFSSDSDYLQPLTLSSRFDEDGKINGSNGIMYHELLSQLSTILLPSEKLHLSSPVLVRTQRQLFGRTKRRILLLTDLPRLLCVKEDNLKVKFEVDLGVGDSDERARVKLSSESKVIVSAGGKDLEFAFDGQATQIASQWYLKIEEFINSRPTHKQQ